MRRLTFLLKAGLAAGAFTAIALTAVLFAQDPARFIQAVEVHRGRLLLGTGVNLEFEGATVDSYSTVVTVTDPTADRTITIPNVTGTLVVTGGESALTGDDAILGLGDGSDQVLLNRSTSLATDTALTSVLIGTPVTTGVAANSLIISGITASGDILIAANRGGNSEEYFLADSSAGVLYLAGLNGGITLGLVADYPAPDVSAVGIWDGTAGSVPAATDTRFYIESSDTTANYLSFLSPNAAIQGILFGDVDDNDIGGLTYDHSTNKFAFTAATATPVNLSSTGLEVHGRLMARESFDQAYFIMQDDATAKSVADNEINVVFGSPVGIITFHEEVTKTTSSWIVADGVLDIKGDNDADNEGVEIRIGWNSTNEGMLVAQTSGACFTVNLTLGDISGTDQMFIGWVQNEAYNATNTYTAYNDWSLVGVNNVDGSIFSLIEVNAGGTLSDDSTVNFADGETRTLRSCILADGTRTASYTAAGGTTFTDITLANGTTAHTAGDQLVPMITFLSTLTDGADITINWMEVSGL